MRLYGPKLLRLFEFRRADWLFLHSLEHTDLAFVANCHADLSRAIYFAVELPPIALSVLEELQRTCDQFATVWPADVP